jgi:hypothetical protein
VAPSFFREVGKRQDAADLSSTGSSLTLLWHTHSRPAGRALFTTPVDRVAHRMLRLSRQAGPRASGAAAISPLLSVPHERHLFPVS